ncbi:MAG TPA: hypothetical protein PKV16_08615 [Caldisericia bacterium]|nr:hypothetical protein [Caldisericia bacterium]HPF49335.1 hypothetical protein [Caldisericia bacterium]HPQ93828.1 hypothetical protein [Caldisericia bacterium]
MGVSEGVLATFSNVVQTAAPFIAALFCFFTMAVFKEGDSNRKGWLFIGLACLSWFLGQVVYTIYEASTGLTVPYPWFPDIGYIITPILAIIGILYIWSALKSKVPTWGWIASLVVLGLALFWAFSLVEPDVPLATFTSYTYSVVDSLLVSSAVLFASSLFGGIIGNQFWIMIAGLILYFLGDQIFNMMNIAGTYRTGGLIDITWPLAFGLIAVTAVAVRTVLTHRY